MNTGEKRATKIAFPFSIYLKQLFSVDTYVRYINPFSFWRRYKIKHLETCRDLNIVQHLERCHQLNCHPEKLSKILLDREHKNTSTNSLIQQAESNLIYVFLPRIKLKYRGVSYYTKNILSMNIKLVKLESTIVKKNSLRHTENSNNINTSEKFGSN
jgi:hypothetical protein